MKIKLNKSSLSIFLCVLFWILVTMGSYWETNAQLITIYLIISCALYARKLPAIVNRIFKSKLLNAWLLYIFIALVSTVIFGMTENIKSVGICICFLFIAFILVELSDTRDLLVSFKNTIIIIAAITVVGYFLSIDVFGFLKEGSTYMSIDSHVGGGISGIFEFRHYFGCFLVSALFLQFRYPSKKVWRNLFAVLVLLLSIIFTYTRSIWIAPALCGLLALARRNSSRIKRSTLLKIGGGVICAVAGMIVFGNYFSDAISNILNRLSGVFQKFEGDVVIGGARGYSLVNGTGYILTHWTKYLWIGGGVGFGIEWLKAHPYGYWTSAVDNQYVTVFMDQGILGLTFLGWIVCQILKKYFKKDTGNVDSVYLILISIFIEIFFFEIIGGCNSIFFWFTVCLCIVCKEETSQRGY